MRQIYLDYNATTPVAPAVCEAMEPFLTRHFGNPSSSHAMGRACHEAIEDARAKVAQMLGADSDEIVFTGGGSESNNLALKGTLMRESPFDGGHLIISSLEHPAITEPARFLERWGYEVTIVPCDRHGVVDPLSVEQAIREDTRLVSIMLANNEIGTLQPIRQISEICRAREVLLHTDAAQAIGKVRTVVDELGVDMLTIAGHKLYAPKGVGALFVRRGVALEPLVHGAGHEGGLRAGTENTAYIVGLGRAAAAVSQDLDEVHDRMAHLRDQLYTRLADAIGDDLPVNGQQAPRLPNTLSVNFPGVTGGELLARAPEICASTGAACHSNEVARSATLIALGVPPEMARGTVRLSVGVNTSDEDIDRAANLLIGAWESLKK